MDSIRLFLQEDTDELGLITKSGNAFISKLERSNFNAALRGVMTLMFRRYPTKDDVKTFLKIKENYPRIKSQFMDAVGDDRKHAKKSNIVWLGFDHATPDEVRFKMEHKKFAWKGTINMRHMKVEQDVKRVQHGG